MPYPNEHAARLRDPLDFDEFSRVNDAGGEGIDFIYGINDEETAIQAIRFDAILYTPDEAKKWLEDHDFTAILFEDAIEMDEANRSVLKSPQSVEAIMAEKEIRSGVPMEFRANAEGEVRVSGYAAVFGEETSIGDMFTEVIQQGAFKDAIGRDDVVFLINHEGLPLARTRSGTLTLREDDHGLFMEAMLDQRDPDVRSIIPKMQRGDLDKMSFAFFPEVQSWDESGALPKRSISKVKLYDVSIVTTPAYSGTEIGLRSLEAHRQQKAKSQAARRMRMKAKFLEDRDGDYAKPQPILGTDAIVSAQQNEINRDAVAENWRLGPAEASVDPSANAEYWNDLAVVWSVSEAEARRRLCANCSYFDNTPEMTRLMEDVPLDAFDMDGGGRGYCHKFDFICHNLRVCQAWERKAYEPEE
jgi:uncharacterized protein